MNEEDLENYYEDLVVYGHALLHVTGEGKLAHIPIKDISKTLRELETWAKNCDKSLADHTYGKCLREAFSEHKPVQPEIGEDNENS